MTVRVRSFAPAGSILRRLSSPGSILLLLSSTLFPVPALAFEFEEKIVAGGPSDFLEVRHIVIRGTNFEIGQKLAELARTDQHATVIETDEALTRAQRNWYGRNFPIFLERMRGAAAGFGLSFEDDRYNFSALGFPNVPHGCSVVFYPPSQTASGRGVLSRNYDFSTGTWSGKRPGSGEIASSCRPYVVELYPEGGIPSLYLCAYDLLGGTVDGINAAGVCGALLADDDKAQHHEVEPRGGIGVGLGEIQMLRYVLDTCTSAKQAREELLSMKHYYSYIPCHYMVADATGDAFVFEYSFSGNVEHVIDGSLAAPLVTTNFMLHEHPTEKTFPSEGYPRGSFNRYRDITQRFRAPVKERDRAWIEATNACVAADLPAPDGDWAPGRTLWHSIYVPEERSLEVSFYLGEAVSPGGETRIRRSEYLRFVLEETN